MSPENVFVTDDGGAKLVDFGIAKAARRLRETRANDLVGKPQCMAPEEAAGVSDRRTDVFAAGVLLHEALTGKPYWVTEDSIAILRRLLAGALPPSPRAIDPRVDPELDRICARALALRPGDRYPTAENFQGDLERFLGRSRPTRSQIATRVSALFSAERARTRALLAAHKSAPFSASGATIANPNPVAAGSEAELGRAMSIAIDPLRPSGRARGPRRWAIGLALIAAATIAATLRPGAHPPAPARVATPREARAASNASVTLAAKPITSRFSKYEQSGGDAARASSPATDRFGVRFPLPLTGAPTTLRTQRRKTRSGETDRVEGTARSPVFRARNEAL